MICDRQFVIQIHGTKCQNLLKVIDNNKFYEKNQFKANQMHVEEDDDKEEQGKLENLGPKLRQKFIEFVASGSRKIFFLRTKEENPQQNRHHYRHHYEVR